MRIVSKIQRNAAMPASGTTAFLGDGVSGRCISCCFGFLLTALILLLTAAGLAQTNNGVVTGTVADQTGAVIPHASVRITTTDGHAVAAVTSDDSGFYQAKNLRAGSYIVNASAPGFAPFASKAVTLMTGQSKQVDIKLQILVEQQQVKVESETMTLDTSPESNANAIVIKDKDLDALSDDPDELQSELQALAGPAAGPNGGEIYIDGFTGGQIPPKSSIREIRINQNPFSAEFDRLGYGRIEIFTKPGTDKLHGQVESRGNYSALNSQNPILNANLKPDESRLQEPGYYSYNFNANVGGPLTKRSSYFLSSFVRDNQNESIVDAVNPANTSSILNEAITNPSSRIDISPRFDFTLGQSNTLTIRDEFFRSVQTNAGLSALTLPTQAYNTHNFENTLQVSDSWVISPRLVDDIHFQYRRIRNQQLPLSGLPTVTVQGAFVNGGNNSGTAQDHQDDYELQNYFAASKGKHSLNFGMRLRAYRDANYTSAGSNGGYIFAGASDYLASKPQQYTYTHINNFVARAILFDSALFYQDDWKLSPRFTLSYGVRWESQNRINDKDDWAPRITLAYGLGKQGSNKQPKTVLRAGYGWFYQRFTVPNTLGSTQGTPYIVQAIHNNFVPLGSNLVPNQQGFTINNPDFYNPTQVVPISGASLSVAPTGYSVDPHFHAAIDMQAAVGVDRQLSKVMTGNISYLYSRGVHTFLTDNASAVGNFPQDNLQSITYPTTPIPAPNENDMQFQSGGVYRQNQIIASLTARYPRFSIFSFYTYNNAHADSSGVAFTPSVAGHAGLDYGRASFDVHNRFVLLGSLTAPWQFTLSPFLSINSGTPYDITTGTDLTGNNQFNARPTFAQSCGQPNAISTRYGCLDPDPLASPTGASERIIPHNLGTGPANVSLNLRISKVFGFGPRVAGNGNGGGQRGGPHGGGLGGRGLSGSQAGPGRMDATTPHKYNLTFAVFGQNIFNHENLGAPNGTLTSPLFGRSQSLAGGFFGPSSAGNRSIFLSSTFTF